MEQSTPEWAYWANMADVLVDEAVWLSLDIDPRYARDPARAWTVDLSAHTPRVEQCLSHIRAGALEARTVSTPERAAPPWHYRVRLTTFCAWAESLPTPLALPEKFPRAAPPAAAPTSTKAGNDDALDARQRTTYLRIIRALIELAGDRLPAGKETTIISNWLSTAGYDSPQEAAIRRAVQAAKQQKPE